MKNARFKDDVTVQSRSISKTTWVISLSAILGLALLVMGLFVSLSDKRPNPGTPKSGNSSSYSDSKPNPQTRATITWEGVPSEFTPKKSSEWNLVDRLSAHNVLILTVETDFLDKTIQIAQELVEERERTYAEIMIYFHQPGKLDSPPARRVQLTPDGGYDETNLEEFYSNPPITPSQESWEA